MPLYVSAPLPGPFRYVSRVSGEGVGRVLYHLLGLSLIVLMFRIMWWTMKGAYLGGRWVARRAARIVRESHGRAA